MKILFFSDIHGVYKNLKYIKYLIKKEKFDKVILLGDIYCKHPNLYNSDKEVYKVKSFLEKIKNIKVIKGNCDDYLYDSKFLIQNGPVKYKIDNHNTILAHGPYEFDLENYNNSILIYGHEHIPYIKKVNTYILICVGSISLPKGNSNPSYMIYDNNEFVIYDIYNNIIDKIDLTNKYC